MCYQPVANPGECSLCMLHVWTFFVYILNLCVVCMCSVYIPDYARAHTGLWFGSGLCFPFASYISSTG